MQSQKGVLDTALQKMDYLYADLGGQKVQKKTLLMGTAHIMNFCITLMQYQRLRESINLFWMKA